MRLFLLLGLMISAAILNACDKKKADGSTDGSSGGSSGPGRYLYVASGLCQGGNGVTTFTAATASNQVFRIDMSTGQRDITMADYWGAGASPGVDTPVGITDWDSTRVAVLVLNGASGRVELVPKVQAATRQAFNLSPSNATVLASAPRQIYKTSDGGLLILRSGGIEKVNASGGRIGAPYVSNNLGATCGTANTIYSAAALSNTSRIVTTVSMITPNTRSASVPATGASGSCSGAMTSPVTTTWPTAVVYDAVNLKMIIAYAGNGTATNVNAIASYDFNETSGALTNQQIIYDSSVYPATYPYLLYSISAMALDPVTNSLYIATVNGNTANVPSTSNNYVIEKFTYDASKIGTANSSVLTRVSVASLPFYNYGNDTKCISQMMVGVY